MKLLPLVMGGRHAEGFRDAGLGLAGLRGSGLRHEHRNERRSDFSVMELSPAQHDVHRLWEPGEVRPMPPEGAMARCRDGRYSFAQDHREACSDHGGVEKWLEAS